MRGQRQLQPGDLFTIGDDPTLYLATEWDTFNGTMRHAVVDPDTHKVTLPFTGGVVDRFARIVERAEGEPVKKGYYACKECCGRPGIELIPREEAVKALQSWDASRDPEQWFSGKLTDKCDICGKRRRLFDARDV